MASPELEKFMCSPKPVQGVPFLSIWNSTQSPNQARCITLLKHWSSCVPTSSMLCAFCQQHLVYPTQELPSCFFLKHHNNTLYPGKLKWLKIRTWIEVILAGLQCLVISFDCHHFRICVWLWLKITESAKSQLWQQTLGTMFTVFFWQHVPASWLKDFTTAGSGGCTPPFSYGNENSIHHLKVVLGLANTTTLIWVNICSINECHTCIYVQCQYKLNIHCIQLDSSVVLVLVLKQS